MINKKYAYLILSLAFTFIILTEIGIRTLLYLKDDYLFKTESHLNFYKKYTARLHHMRDTITHPKKPEDYLFNLVKEKGINYKTILFQGDSRTEQLNFYPKEKMKKLDFNIYNGGTTSFSPSSMSIQFDILVNEFNIKPNIVVILLDPTDIGDEFCRYKDQTIIKDNKIHKIKTSEIKGDFYFYKNIFFLSELKFSKLPKFLHLFDLMKQVLKYNTKVSSNCKYDKIQSHLIKKNKISENYFKNIFLYYIENILSYDFVENIYVVTYPHIQHLDKKYYGILYNRKNNELFRSFNLTNINHIDLFEKKIFEKFNNDYFSVFIEGDHASHLTDKGVDIFFDTIFDEVNKKLK